MLGSAAAPPLLGLSQQLPSSSRVGDPFSPIKSTPPNPQLFLLAVGSGRGRTWPAASRCRWRTPSNPLAASSCLTAPAQPGPSVAQNLLLLLPLSLPPHPHAVPPPARADHLLQRLRQLRWAPLQEPRLPSNLARLANGPRWPQPASCLGQSHRLGLEGGLSRDRSAPWSQPWGTPSPLKLSPVAQQDALWGSALSVPTPSLQKKVPSHGFSPPPPGRENGVSCKIWGCGAPRHRLGGPRRAARGQGSRPGCGRGPAPCPGVHVREESLDRPRGVAGRWPHARGRVGAYIGGRGLAQMGRGSIWWVGPVLHVRPAAGQWAFRGRGLRGRGAPRPRPRPIRKPPGSQASGLARACIPRIPRPRRQRQPRRAGPSRGRPGPGCPAAQQRPA